MRVSITCEFCKQRHRVERKVEVPGPIYIVCHNCEAALCAVLEPEVINMSKSLIPKGFKGTIL